MDIQVIEKKELKVVGISWNGNYSQMNKIPELFHEFKDRLKEIKEPKDDSVLIAPFHSRETDLTYYLTKAVKKIDDIPAGMVGFTIPQKNYVYATHMGLPNQVGDTYQKIFAWMKEYGYEQDYQALSLEIYEDEIKNINSLETPLLFDIYIPVKKY